MAAHGITLRAECERVFRVCTLTLKKCAAAGLSPSQVAGIVCREGLTKSVIEKLHSNALHLARAAGGGSGMDGAGRAGRDSASLAAYMRHMDALLDEYLEEYLLECADLLY